MGWYPTTNSCALNHCELLVVLAIVEVLDVKVFFKYIIFERGPLPYIHLTSTRHNSRDRCLQPFPVFAALLLPCIILNANRKTKNGGGLGTRLVNASGML